MGVTTRGQGQGLPRRQTGDSSGVCDQASEDEVGVVFVLIGNGVSMELPL